MSRFSTSLPVEEIYSSERFYTVIFKSEKLKDDMNFIFKYNKDINVNKYEGIIINQIEINATYINVNKNKVICKDNDLNIIASFEIPYGKILTIRKYHIGKLKLSVIGLEKYLYIIAQNEDKINDESGVLKHRWYFEEI